MGLGSEQHQRVSGQQIRVAARPFACRRVGREGVVPRRRQGLRVQLGPAGGGRKVPVGKVQERIGDVDPEVPVVVQHLPIGLGQVSQGRREQFLVGVGESGFVESHGPGESTEQLRVRHRVADRGDRGVVDAEIQAAPRRHDIELFDLGGGRQDHVGVAGRVGHELLVHHREEVVASSPRRVSSVFGTDTSGLPFHASSTSTGGSTVGSVR